VKTTTHISALTNLKVQRADLAFRIGGRLTYIFVKEGDQVKQGQLLAKLDDRDAQTAFESAQLELKNARAEYQRGKAIFEKSQAIAKSDLDTLTTRFNLAQNRLEEAKRQLEYTQLKAPFDGIVGRKMVDNHVQVQANMPIIAIHDVQNLDDNHVQVQANMPIIAIHDVQNLEVVINIPDTVMLYGLKETKAKAELSSIPGKDFAITVPLTAVVPDNQGKQFVWVVNDKNHVEKRYVKVGALSSSRIEITECLVPGERIIIAGVASLKDGMQVRPYTDDNSGA